MTSRTVRSQMIAAVAWSAALIPAALFLPIADPQRTTSQLRNASVRRWISLTQNSGPGILWIPIATLVLALLAAYFLARQTHDDGLGPSRVAMGLGVIVLLGAIAGTVTFLIGVFLVPTAVLILLASGESRHDAMTRSTSPSQRASKPECGHVNNAAARYCSSCGEALTRSDRSAT
jgi:hypothetical protein